MCSYMILMLNKSAEEVSTLFTQSTSFLPYCDASSEKNEFELHLCECLKGFEKALRLGWFSMESFNLQAYEMGALVEYGAYNWIIPGKVLAFLCPSFDHRGRDGIKPLTPEQYVPIFQELGVNAVVRLNKKNYEADRFARHGFRFHEMYFIDGSVPSEAIIKEFIKVLEEDLVVAVHCKAGLGRTATLIGCYAMKHFGFTALEFIAWARICRPGSVLGPQQQFLVDLQETCWRWGENFRNGVEDNEENKEVEHCTGPEGDRFKARYGDYRQAERLCVNAPSGEHGKTEVVVARAKVIKKIAFSKHK